MTNNFEKWVEVEEAPNYYISNWGRCKKLTMHTGFHFIKPYVTNKHYTNYMVKFMKDKKIKIYSLAKLVWKYFGDYELKKIWSRENYILHKDGDTTNNKIENLYTTAGYSEKIRRKQCDIYNSYAEKYINFIAKKMYKQLKYNNIEVEEFVQNAMIRCWRYINDYVENEPFFNFCIYHSKYTLKDLIVKQKIKDKNEISMCELPQYIQDRY